jgi:hypothetical protein
MIDFSPGLFDNQIMFKKYRRDIIVFTLASAVMALVCFVPFALAMQNERKREEQALEAACEAKQSAEAALEQSKRNLVDQAAQLLHDFEGNGDKAESEVLRVTTNAVAPEIPEGAYLLIDKKPSGYAAGDIVVYRVDGKNYLGRVIAAEPTSGQLTVGRNGEPNRQVPIKEMLGRGVMNTR